MNQSAVARAELSPLLAAVEHAIPADAAARDLLVQSLVDPACEILRRPGKAFRARLVESCWLLAGGRGRPPAQLPLVLELLHVGSLIVDDIEDESQTRRGGPSLHRLVGVPVALNTGNWLYFVALELIDKLGLEPNVTLALHRDSAAALARCHEGQALDVAVSMYDLPRAQIPEVVAAVTRRKTGTLMELAARLGATAAGASAEDVDRLAEFGSELGIGLQMLDDLGGVASPARADKGLEDLRHGRPTWPWAWLAESVDEPFFSKIRAAGRVGTDTALAELVRVMRPHAQRRRGLVHARLQSALKLLAQATNGHPLARAMAGEVARLEKSYG